MKSRILFTGVTGLIGRYFVEGNPAPERIEILGLARKERPDWRLDGMSSYVSCDLADPLRFREILREFGPEVIVHAGAEGNVDEVERQPEHFASLSSAALAMLLEESAKLKARFVHFSSNAVYDGANAPYREDSPALPVNSYGRIKARSDREVRTYPGNWVILRPTVTYGWNLPSGRANPVSAFLPRVLGGQSLKMVDDQWENPVYAGDVAGALWKCLESGFQGEVNVGGSDARINRFEWMRAVAAVFGNAGRSISPAKIADFPAAAPRPRDTSFDIGGLRLKLGYFPKSVREGALAMKEDLKRSHLQGVVK